jgi:hypothetical protein
MTSQPLDFEKLVGAIRQIHTEDFYNDLSEIKFFPFSTSNSGHLPFTTQFSL